MKKSLKLLSIITLTLVILLGLGYAALSYFVKPETFKSQITNLVKEKTGQTLTINGNISWALMPLPGLKITELELRNPAGFPGKNLAEMKEVDIAVNPLTLLSKTPSISRIKIKGATINVIRLRNNKHNFEALMRGDSKARSAEIHHLAITDTTINWNDQKNKDEFTIKDFALKSSNIQFKNPFKVSLKGVFDQPSLNTSTQFTTSGKLGIDESAKNITLDNVTFSLAMEKLKPTKKLLINGAIDATMNTEAQTFKISKLNVRSPAIVAKINYNGKKGQVDLEQANLGEISSFFANAKTNSNISDLKADFETKNNVMTGELSINKANISTVDINNLKSQFTYQNQLLSLSPMKGYVEGGLFSGTAKIKVNPKNPSISLNGNMNAPVTRLTGSSQMTGQANITVNVNTQGVGQKALMRNLRGRVTFSVKNGRMKGLDLAYQATRAFHYIKNKTIPPVSQGGSTAFSSLTGSANIAGGVATNNNLLLTAPNLKVAGRGSVNLLSQRIQYRMFVTALDIPNADTIPVIVTGTLSNPKALPDFAYIAKTILKQHLQDQIRKNIGDKIGPIGPGGINPLDFFGR